MKSLFHYALALAGYDYMCVTRRTFHALFNFKEGDRLEFSFFEQLHHIPTSHLHVHGAFLCFEQLIKFHMTEKSLSIGTAFEEIAKISCAAAPQIGLQILR